MAISSMWSGSSVSWGSDAQKHLDTSKPSGTKFQGRLAAKERDQEHQASLARYYSQPAPAPSPSPSVPQATSTTESGGGGGDTNFDSFSQTGNPNGPLSVPGYGTDRQNKNPNLRGRLEW